MIIKNKYIPFKGFVAIAIYPLIFVRSDIKINSYTINHENIHFAQQKELLIIPFYIIYLFEYFILRKKYRDISFEKEAYKHDNNQDYLKTRKHFAQWL